MLSSFLFCTNIQTYTKNKCTRKLPRNRKTLLYLSCFRIENMREKRGIRFILKISETTKKKTQQACFTQRKI